MYLEEADVQDVLRVHWKVKQEAHQEKQDPEYHNLCLLC